MYRSECLSRARFSIGCQFCDGGGDLEDDQHALKSRTSRTEGNIERVKEILRSDYYMSAGLIEELTDITKIAVNRILTDGLDKRNVCARFVPHMVTDDPRQAKIVILDSVFLSYFVTRDEMWYF